MTSTTRTHRSPRRMPSMKKIEDFWGLEHGYCARCHQPARCEKAHIIDRCSDGLDGEQNLIPLCYPCHDKQPAFRPGEEPFALAWVQGHLVDDEDTVLMVKQNGNFTIMEVGAGPPEPGGYRMTLGAWAVMMIQDDLCMSDRR